MNQPRSLESLAPKATPTFEQPFEMMEACHERLARTLALMDKLRVHVASQGADEGARQAARDVMRYFDMAAPQHHEDEERHVFPPLLAQGDAAAVAVVRELQAEHVRMEAGWARVREILSRIANAQAASLAPGDEAELDAFSALYRGHIPREESVAYAAARGLIGEEALRAAGAEMRQRRGG